MCCGWEFTATCCCLLGSKRKLPTQAYQVRPGLPSVVCHPRGMQFPGTMYICSQGHFSSAWAHCISCVPSVCSHCRRCCCCPVKCDKRRMETHLNSAGGPVPYRRSWSLSFLHLLSVLSSPLLLSKSIASWHIPQAIQRNDKGTAGVGVFVAEEWIEKVFEVQRDSDRII